MKAKVLVIRFSSIGDIVLTTPVLRCLKQQVEGIEIHYLTKKSFHPVLEANPYIDKFYLLDNNMNELLEEMMQENYTHVIDLHHNLRTLRVKFHLQTISHSFNKLNISKWLMVNLRVNLLPQKHIVQRYLDTCKSLGVRNDHKGLDFFIPREDEIQVEEFPLTHLHGFVAVVLGAVHYTKRIPYEKLVELCDALSIPIILIGGPNEKLEGDDLAKLYPFKVYNTCGTLSINQSASIIKQAKAVITSDTGMMHIAAAFKKKIISVWGNTIPEFGMYPYFGRNEDLTRKDTLPFKIAEIKLSCRPCSKIGFAECPKKHFNCMMKQDMVALANDIVE